MSRVKLSNVYVPSYCCFIMQPRGPHWAQMWRRKLAVDIVQWTCNGQSGIIAHTCVAEEASPSCSGGGHCSVDTASRGKPLLDNQVSDEIPSLLATVPPPTQLHYHHPWCHCTFLLSQKFIIPQLLKSYVFFDSGKWKGYTISNLINLQYIWMKKAFPGSTWDCLGFWHRVCAENILQPTLM